MQLFRVSSVTKTTKEGETVPNPNLGRFFFARKVERLDEEGNTVLNANGYPEEDLGDFQWIDRSPYIRSGAFASLANPALTQLLLHSFGANIDVEKMWPAELLAGLA